MRTTLTSVTIAALALGLAACAGGGASDPGAGTAAAGLVAPASDTAPVEASYDNVHDAFEALAADLARQHPGRFAGSTLGGVDEPSLVRFVGEVPAAAAAAIDDFAFPLDVSADAEHTLVELQTALDEVVAAIESGLDVPVLGVVHQRSGELEVDVAHDDADAVIALLPDDLGVPLRLRVDRVEVLSPAG